MTDSHALLQANLARVRARIVEACLQCGRDPASVQLIAVSKTQDAAAVRSAHANGQRHFGENYLQEALEKQVALQDCAIEWHFIGPIQSNKTRDIAAQFDWVHSVDRAKVAERLQQQRPAGLPRLRVLLQVNLEAEPGKSGVAPGELEALAAVVEHCDRLELRGLMAIPAPTPDVARQRQFFRALAAAAARLRAAGHAGCLELSMGMSADMEAAIAEGATMVRIGTDIFGARVRSKS